MGSWWLIIGKSGCAQMCLKDGVVCPIEEATLLVRLLRTAVKLSAWIRRCAARKLNGNFSMFEATHLPIRTYRICAVMVGFLRGGGHGGTMRVSVGDFLIRRRRASRILITTGCFRGLYTAALLLTTSIMSAVLTAPATTGVSHVHVEIKYIPAPDLSLPALAVQVTRLVDSYMLWAGTTDVSADDVQNVTLQGHLAKDWACAMPARDVSTSLILGAFNLGDWSRTLGCCTNSSD